LSRQRLRRDNSAARELVDQLSRIAAPKGSVAAFNSDACPDGWSKYAPAVGRFIRGIDPDIGERGLGSLEEDAFQGHTFGGDGKVLRWSTNTSNDPPNGYSEMRSTGFYGENPAFGPRTNAEIVSDGKSGQPRLADETRPKNVGLLFCERN
jgi:hypothetical protein